MASQTDPLAPALNIERARRALKMAPIGRAIYYYARLESTMPLAHELAAAGVSPSVAAGTMIVTEEQTSGRGRLDRVWHAPARSSLLTSVIISDELLPAEIEQLPMIAGLALLAAVNAIAPNSSGKFGLKWPNDLLWVNPAADPPLAKIAGLLIEGRLGAKQPYAVIGLGVNVLQSADELPVPRPEGTRPASLYTALGQRLDRTDLLIQLARSFSELLDPTERPSPDTIHARWRDNLVGLDRTVQISDGTGPPWVGRAVGATRLGELIIQLPNGECRMVRAGDVSVLWNS